MALDGKDGVFDAFGVGAVPTVILIDREGRVVRRFHHAGVPELEAEVKRLLAGADAGSAVEQRAGDAEQPAGTTHAGGQPADGSRATATEKQSEAEGTAADAPAGRLFKTLEPSHEGPITGVAFAPDGRLLATAAMHERGGHGPNLVKLRHPGTGELRSTLNTAVGDPPIDRVVSEVVFSPDGRKLAVSGGVLYHGQVVLFDVETGKVDWFRQEVADTTDVGIAFSPDGRLLASTGVAPRDGGGKRKQQVTLWEVATGKRMRTLEGSDGYLMSVAFAPDGTTLAIASSHGGVDLWNLKSGEIRLRLRGAGFDPRASGYAFVAFSPDGKRLAVGHSDGALRIWNPADGTLERELPIGKRRPHTIAFSPSGKLLACGNWVEESISLWDVQTGEERVVIAKEAGGGTVFAFSPDGKALATGTKEGVVRLVPIDVAKVGLLGPGPSTVSSRLR
jgi:WD40 repeat protein